MRLTTSREGEHHVTVPKHKAIKPGILNAILKDVASHLGKSKQEVVEELLRER